jgi:phage shock protein PspC (stress-responsive transcriptional regulator)
VLLRTVGSVDLAPPPSDAAPAPAPPPVPDDEPERVFGGVAALLAPRLGIDPLWLRIAFVLLAFIGGLGLLLYGGLWLALIVGADPDRTWARFVGGAVLLLGIPLLLTDAFGFLDGPWAIVALLAGLAVALWQRPLGTTLRSATSARPAPAPAVEPPADVPEVPSRRPTRPRWRPTPRPPSILGRATLGIAVLVAAIGALVDQANGGRLHPEQWLGAAAAVCGVGLLVGAFAGRALWLVLPAAAFAGTGFVAGEAARLGIEPTTWFGDEYVSVFDGQPGGWHERDHVVIGSVEVTASGAPQQPVSVDARVAMGEVRVRAADDVTVEVRADVDHGDVQVLGVDRPNGTYTIGPEGPPDVVVTARVGRGDISIQYAPRDRPPPDLPDVPELSELRQQGQFLTEGVQLGPSGQFVLAEGEAVIGADNRVLVGSTQEEPEGVIVIDTSFGAFRLLPGNLLLTPFGEILDLDALRGSTAPTETTAPAGGTVPVTTVPTQPTTPGS